MRAIRQERAAGRGPLFLGLVDGAEELLKSSDRDRRSPNSSLAALSHLTDLAAVAIKHWSSALLCQ